MEPGVLMLQAVLSGPGECHRMQIDARLHEHIVLVGRDDEHHIVDAVFDDGQWSEMSWQTVADSYHRPFVRHAPSLPIPAPAIGRLDGEASAGLSRLLGHLAGDVQMLYPSGQGFVLMHTLESQRGSPVLEVEAQQAAEQGHIAWLSAHIDGVVTGEWGRMRGMVWRVALNDDGLPTEEHFSATFGRGVWRMKVEYTLLYRQMGPCS